MKGIDPFDINVPIEIRSEIFNPKVGDIVHVWKDVGLRFTRDATFQTSERVKGSDIVGVINPKIDLLVTKKLNSTSLLVKIADLRLGLATMGLSIRIHTNHLNPDAAYNKKEK